MRRCMHCGREGVRMTPIHNRWIKRIDGYRCTGVQACNDRVRVLGKWIGKRVLHRRDADGTRWTIRRHDDIGLRGMSSGPWHSGYVLLCEYRQHRLTTHHETIATAKAHVEDVLASWVSRSLKDYAGRTR